MVLKCLHKLKSSGLITRGACIEESRENRQTMYIFESRPLYGGNSVAVENTGRRVESKTDILNLFGVGGQ